MCSVGRRSNLGPSDASATADCDYIKLGVLNMSSWEYAMSTRHLIPDSKSNDATAADPQPIPPPDTVEGRRARRMNALKAVAGLWKDREDLPAEALEYQRAMRAEWL